MPDATASSRKSTVHAKVRIFQGLFDDVGEPFREHSGHFHGVFHATREFD